MLDNMRTESLETKSDQRPDKSTSRFKEFTPELLDHNFQSWRAKLEHYLAQKYPNKPERDMALKEADDFSRNLSLLHCMKLNGVHSYVKGDKFLHSVKKLRETRVSFSAISGTNQDDVAFKRDEYIFLTYGDAVFTGKDSIAFAIDPEILNREGTLVSLEDLAFVCRRVPLRPNKQFSYENALEQQKNEIWRGRDFKILFPYFLAISFDKPIDYFSKELSPMFYESKCDVVESDLLNRIASFEVMVPEDIPHRSILFVAIVGESGSSLYPSVQGIENDLKLIGKEIIKIPSKLDRAGRSSLLLMK